MIKRFSVEMYSDGSGTYQKDHDNGPCVLYEDYRVHVTILRNALQPFANFACDPPCGCFNCIAKEAMEITK